jgi:hypothetical protein
MSAHQKEKSPGGLSHLENARLTMDFIHRLMMHHAMWYAEVQKQLGREEAQKILKTVYQRSWEIQAGKLSKTLGFQLKDNIPAPLLDLPVKKLDELKKTIAVNWLANDGIWFQAVEFSLNMAEAKKCNDSCWSNFSPFEAWSIKMFLNLPERPGLTGLKKALDFRLYAAINRQSFSEETDHDFVFRMDDCRVQSARKRKGLADYPCKSAGIIEYSTFAESIDDRIKTDCLACPPDPHPEEWYCSWRFSLEKTLK